VFSGIAYIADNTLLAAEYLLVGQFVVTLALLPSWLLIDIRLLFAFLYTMYGGAGGLTVLVGKVPEYAGLADATALYATGLIGFNLALAVRPGRLVLGTNASVSVPVLPVGALCVGVISAIIYGGVLGYSPGYDAIKRSTDVAALSQLWTVMTFAIQGLAFYCVVHFRRLGWLLRLATILALAGFVAFHLALGNRREYAPIVLAALLVAFGRTRFAWPAGAMTMAMFFIIGVIRQPQAPFDQSVRTTIEQASKGNEFSVPIETTAYYVTHSAILHYGTTYLRTPLYAIPRTLWRGKPVSLSTDFLLSLVGRTDYQGFAFNPVTEAFLNFGWIGPFVVLGFCSVMLRRVLDLGTRSFGYYVVCCCLTPDFQRGEFGTALYQAVFVLVAYRVCELATGLRLTGSVLPSGASRRGCPMNLDERVPEFARTRPHYF
jgi:hypothetical protein